MILENVHWSKIFLIEYILKASFCENLNIQALFHGRISEIERFERNR